MQSVGVGWQVCRAIVTEECGGRGKCLKRKKWKVGRGLQGKGVFGGYPRDGNVSRFGGVWVVCVFGVEFVFVGAASVLTAGFSQ